MLLCLLLVQIVWILSIDAATNCTSKTTLCPNNGICNPNTMQCVDQNATIKCGGYGDFLNCGSNGVVFGECGSGENADCYSSLCPDKKEGYEAINCNYPGLEPQNGPFNTTSWLCGVDGTHLSCFDDAGSVLVGVCGSGKHEDCQTECKGYHGILCADQSYFNIDFTKCSWVTGGYGEWTYCPEGTVATGHCGSAKKADCGHKDWHAIQCCNFVYSK